MTPEHPSPDLQPTLRDYEARAKAILGADRAAYFFGGAADERTLEANQKAISEIELIPRMLRDLRGGSTRLTLLGQHMPHPILVAPVAYQRLVYPDGEIAMAMGAGAQDAAMVLSAQSSIDAAAVRTASAACTWFQLYWGPSREANLALVRRMANLGFTAIVLTVDAPVQGVRDNEVRTGFRLPAIAKAVNGAVPVLMDGGIRRGTDVLKALALGATAVLAGRMAIAGLTVAGAAGVSHVLRLLRDELEIAMMLTGCATLKEITQGIIYRNE